ncbi:MAG TPA: hypothetical protein VEB42_09070 [Chitinophagaceae bacterium]|nr:hypothetical protein [Chitinophagaceae bacterium]
MRVILFLLICHASLAQPVVKKLDKSSIPSAIKYTGNIKNAVTWNDDSGEHIVITTETGISAFNADGVRGGMLYAYHFVNNTQLWRVTDGIKDCSFDVKANFIKNTFAITDLDKNGKPEAWLMYTTVCTSDVSPAFLKIIMYEGTKKYAMRGRSKIQVAEKEFAGGTYTFDDAFKSAPQAFRTYAENLWKKNILETW